MKIEKVCVLGGTGFVGAHLVARLVNLGYSVRVPTRRRERHRNLLVMPQVELCQLEDLSPQSLQSQLAGCDAVINLIGILNGTEAAFQKLHAELPAAIVEACQAVGVQRYLHMSALNADAENGPSIYLRTKGAGEDAAHAGAAQGLLVSSFRPSVIFGPDDQFFNRFATLLKAAPVLPLACPEARFAPVYLDDVVQAFVVALERPETAGQRYDLYGPKVYTLRELVQYTAQMIGRRRLVWGLSDKLSRLEAKVMESTLRWLPGGPPLSFDNYQSMQVDSVGESDGLAALGITPRSVESVMPKYFGGELSRLRYNELRRDSRR